MLSQTTYQMLYKYYLFLKTNLILLQYIRANELQVRSRCHTIPLYVLDKTITTSDQTWVWRSCQKVSVDIHRYYALCYSHSFFQFTSFLSNQDLMSRHVGVQLRRSETARPKEDTDITSLGQLPVSVALLGFALVVPAYQGKQNKKAEAWDLLGTLGTIQYSSSQISIFPAMELPGKGQG